MGIFSKTKDLKILERINSKASVKRHIQFVLGCFLIAISYNLFLAPNNIVAGGVGGLAIILNYLTKIDNSIVILVADILLLILSYFLLGKNKTKATILGSILFPLFVSLTSNISAIVDIDTNQLLLISVFGGVVYGFGAGMIYKAGFTTGGTDIINQILSKYLKISMGNSMLYCDGTIVLLTAFVFGPTHFMYSIIVLYVISFMSDRVILGVSDSKAFYIVTREEKKIKEYINENSMNNIELLGFLNAEQVKEYVRKSRFVVVPSVWYENCPYSILETLAMGKPIIGSNLGGIPELVKNNKNGLIYKYNNADELTEKMNKLFEDKNLAEELGRGAKKFAEEEFSKERYYTEIINIYEGVIKNGK